MDWCSNSLNSCNLQILNGINCFLSNSVCKLCFLLCPIYKYKQQYIVYEGNILFSLNADLFPALDFHYKPPMICLFWYQLNGIESSCFRVATCDVPLSSIAVNFILYGGSTWYVFKGSINKRLAVNRLCSLITKVPLSTRCLRKKKIWCSR